MCCHANAGLAPLSSVAVSSPSLRPSSLSLPPLQVPITLNAAFCERHRKVCPPSDELERECGKVGAWLLQNRPSWALPAIRAQAPWLLELVPTLLTASAVPAHSKRTSRHPGWLLSHRRRR